MKSYRNKPRSLIAYGAVGVALASIVAFSVQSITFAQTTGESHKAMSSKSMCPMMTGLKGIKLTADSPPLLMARADELKLTEQQKRELKSIAEEAQRKATKVLTSDQQSRLGDAPHKPMSMMEIAMMRSSNMDDEKSGEMCPMCKKKMDEMMEGKMMKRNKNVDHPTSSSE
ncbi:secreted protein [Rhodopirellula maiorica SM1]|uniref:Secreted protein n=1 Tax=Rhodopirellula maiorica SM1 TaxID=1265738 RepID=M5RDY4_9BACT|nr:hypothetical protein [Rhodopirellula maiorica]EMI17595.1 secreted protein [Rhodopirellula maiorica SM1]